MLTCSAIGDSRRAKPRSNMAFRARVLVVCAIEYNRGDITRSTADGNFEAVRASSIDRV